MLKAVEKMLAVLNHLQ